MRLFVGVGLPPAVSDGLAAAVAEWRRTPGAKWVRPELYHLTLQFIGDYPETRLPELERALQGVVFSAFRVEPGEPLTFPALPQARVLALSLREGGDDLARLAGRVMDATATCGVPRERRPFRAHLTLARAGRDRFLPPELAPDRLRAPILPGFEVEAFNLYESRLRPEGPEYRVLGTRRSGKR